MLMGRVGDRWPRWIAVWVALAAVYFIGGKLGLKLAFVHPSATPVWALSGISLAALLLIGNRAWPGIFVGAFLVNLATAGSIVTCLGIGAGNTLESLSAAWLLNRYAGGGDAFQTPQGFFKFAALGGALSTTVSATIGVASLVLTGYADWADSGPIWLTWWLGDAMGDLLVAPFIVLWAADWKVRWNPRQAAEAAFLFLILLAVSFAVFGGWPAPGSNYPLEIVCVPILLWAAFRFGAREAVTATVILAAIAIAGTLRGVGPFARTSLNTSLLLLQVYIGVVAIMSAAVAASLSERKRILDRLRESERRLERHASDMEEFAYAANHDLREPLRTISLFAQLLAQRCLATMGHETTEYVGRIIAGVSRMEMLVKGLLDYSSLVHIEHPPARTVHLPDVFDTVQKNLETMISENGARIIYGELPELQANREQLVSLFQNLIANAIKYRSTDPPVIEITADRNEHAWIFSVRDNGMGIDPQYHEKIFGLFKRLHGQDVEGNGLGLAIARRIVERHGGRIWVESETSGGATFKFSIPLQDGMNPPSTPASRRPATRATAT